MKGIHLVTNGEIQAEQLEIVPELIGYIDYIHIREKQKTANELYDIITHLLTHGIPPKKIIVNDRVDLAYLTGVRGVQLAYHSLPTSHVKEGFSELLIGKSVHSVEEAVLAEQKGADYLLYGHIFASLSKPQLPPRGLNKLSSLCQSINIPVIAIGGITADNLPLVLQAGAKGAAFMSAVWNAEDPVKVVREVKQSYDKWEEANIAAF